MFDRRHFAAIVGGSLALPGLLRAQAPAVSVLDFVPAAERARIAAGTSSFDCTAAFVEAARSGRPVYVPAGRYRVAGPIRLRIGGVPPFVPGPAFIGEGIGRSVIVATGNGPVFDIDSDADHRAQFKGTLGVRIEGLSIVGAPGNRGSGIRLQTAYMASLRQLHIAGLSGDGIILPALVLDTDASNMVAIEQVRIEQCGGWGIDAKGAPGHNELSFLKLDQVFIQGCGTRGSAAAPSSGGMRYKGQIATLEQCAFTLCENVALYVPGEAGLAQSIEVRSTAFENNRARHVLCTGVSGFKMRSVQFYNNDAYRATVACEFSGASHTVRFVDIDGAVVRATAGNAPLTAFRIGGVHAQTATCRVRNVIWENYDHPGQQRFDGFAFDRVADQSELTVVESRYLVLRPGKAGGGNSVPLRLRGRGSSSGEWVDGQLPKGGVTLRLEGSAGGNVYLYDRDGAMALEASSAPPESDPATGYAVKRGDATRTFVGTVRAKADGFEAAAR